MEICNPCKYSMPSTRFVPQAAGMPYPLYLSLQGKYFIGQSQELQFGNGKSAWAGLFNPSDSQVNLHVYFWQVENTGASPLRAQIWFNSNPPGISTRVTDITSTNTALYPPPKPRIKLLQASDVIGDPTGGVKAFVRRAQAGATIGDDESGKFIFPPAGSFVIFLSTPEAPTQSASAVVSFAWYEEKRYC